MSRFSLSLLLIFSSVLGLQAQETIYTVTISEVYYAKIFLEDASELSSMGWIAIYDKTTNKELIRQDSVDLYIDYDLDGKPSINVVELPYGSQSSIIYNDFNFDGIKDFALRDGNNSCYGGPSYQVYLADGKGDFVYDENFTDLAQSYCGFFMIDYNKKQINTMTKSGCCWHWYYRFDVANNKPRMRQEIEEKLNFSIPFIINNTISRWDTQGNKTEKDEAVLYLDNNGNEVLFSFDLKNKDRTVMLIDEGETLYYTFIKQNEDKDSIAEFYYPNDKAAKEDQSLTYKVNNGEETLTFSNESAKYEIYNSKNKVGVRVTTNGKVYDMPGKVTSRNVTYFFDKLEGLTFNNLNSESDTRLDSITK